jgi:hypothetical protein
MYAIGTDITTGDVMIRNYANDTAIRIPANDIALVADMVRNEYPECEFCEGTRVDGYCTDCGQDTDGGRRAPDRVEAAPPGEHDHVGACVLCGAHNESCCEHCPGNSAYDQAAVQAALDEETP